MRAGKFTAAAEDALTSWAEAVDLLADARARWQEAGRPALGRGSTGQEAQHPLARALERAQRHEAKLGAALERILRRIPKDEGMPIGAEPVPGRPGVVRSPDGVDYFRTSKGQWIRTMDEFNAGWGYLIKVAPGSFVKAPMLEMDDETGAGWPASDRELRGWARLEGVPAGPVLAWAEKRRSDNERWLRCLGWPVESAGSR